MGVEKLNSTLVCIIGTLRGGNKAHHSLIDNVLRPLQADLALLIGFQSATASLMSSPLQHHAMHVWRIPEARGWNHLLDELVPSWALRILRSSNRSLKTPSSSPNSLLRNNVWGGIVSPGQRLPLKGSGAIIFSLRWVLLGYLDALRGHRYKQIVLTRSDHFHGCEHPKLPVVDGTIYIPEGEDYWGGVTDRHSIFAFSARPRVLGILPWLIEHDDPKRIGNPEQALWQYLAAQKVWVQRIPRSMAVVTRGHHRGGDDGSLASGKDASRWGTTTTEPMPGACHDDAWLKYASEYPFVAGTCNLTMTPCASHQRTATANFLRWCDLQRTHNATRPLRECGLKLRAAHRAAVRKARLALRAKEATVPQPSAYDRRESF